MVRLTEAATALVAVGVVLSPLADADRSSLPPHHPSADLLRDFGGQFRCPYASEWLAKGPEQASRDLVETMERRRRKLEGEENGPVMGSCSYTNQRTGSEACIEFRGEGWGEEMAERCDDAMVQGTLTAGVGCALPDAMAGWCHVQTASGVEAIPLEVGTGGCNMAKQTCETFMGGSFEGTGECVPTSSKEDEDGNAFGGVDWGAGAAPAEDVNCAIAPGPIGAAHQAAYSMGYLNNCPGTPAESSPYMWPLRWSAEIEGKTMPFGTDEVMYHHRGIVYYALDKNWKRSDTHYQEGVLRTIGQAPCKDGEIVNDSDAPIACERDPNKKTTMLHRGPKMFFIKWGNGTNTIDDVSNIVDCNWLDLKVVGNVRPDWFLDDRGDSTDVQYLGNQHVYHASDVPRLVKQWRKKDFANHYFVMSMVGNPTPEENNTHWPLILNIPGEGFGDDQLQHYRNHRTLTEEDDSMFLLDEALVAAGGSCPQRALLEGATEGPPKAGKEPIPSNLEVDPNSWVTSVVTYSPVWDPPAIEEDSGSDSSESDDDKDDDVAISRAGDAGTIASCFDPSTGEVHLTMNYEDVAVPDGDIPWLALAFRPEERCLMTPRGGGDGKVIFVLTDEDTDELSATYGPLSPSAKGFSASQDILANHAPLNEVDGFSHGEVTVEDGTVTLHFRRIMVPELTTSATATKRSGVTPEAPDVMHLTYAIGTSSQLGYHGKRECFKVVDFPPCHTRDDSENKGEDEDGLAEDEDEVANVSAGKEQVPVGDESSSSGLCPSLAMSALVAVAGIVFAF